MITCSGARIQISLNFGASAVMAKLANLKVLRETVLEMAGRGIRAERQGKRLRSVTLDVYNARMVIHVRGCRDLRSALLHNSIRRGFTS